jgi:hypothetical protein
MTRIGHPVETALSTYLSFSGCVAALLAVAARIVCL